MRAREFEARDLVSPFYLFSSSPDLYMLIVIDTSGRSYCASFTTVYILRSTLYSGNPFAFF